MQPLNDKDYGREMRCVNQAKDAIEAARKAMDRIYMQCATRESEDFYEGLELQLTDILEDLEAHDSNIFEASQPQAPSFYEVENV